MKKSKVQAQINLAIAGISCKNTATLAKTVIFSMGDKKQEALAVAYDSGLTGKHFAVVAKQKLKPRSIAALAKLHNDGLKGKGFTGVASGASKLNPSQITAAGQAIISL